MVSFWERASSAHCVRAGSRASVRAGCAAAVHGAVLCGRQTGPSGGGGVVVGAATPATAAADIPANSQAEGERRSSEQETSEPARQPASMIGRPVMALEFVVLLLLLPSLPSGGSTREAQGALPLLGQTSRQRRQAGGRASERARGQAAGGPLLLLDASIQKSRSQCSLARS